MNRSITMSSPSPKSKRGLWMALPAFVWCFLFLLIPFAIVFTYSFLTRGPYGGIVYQGTIDNYARLVDWVYLRILLNSVKLALATTVICLCLGYPTAYVMATMPRRWRGILLAMIMLPFFTNFVIRAYAFKTLLGIDGPLVQALLLFSMVHEPIPLTNNIVAVWLGMITNYLPFMVLPLYATLERFDFTLLEAARDLGAGRRAVVARVLLPLSLPGIKAGCLLVFLPALGEFIIPDMLGGAKVMLMGNLITEQFLRTRDWPFGSALAMVLLLAITLLYGSRYVLDSLHARRRR